MTSIPDNIRDGIDNLLFNCIGAKAGDSLAIVTEEGADSYYSATLDGVIAARARERSLHVSFVVAPVLEEVSSFPDDIQRAFEAADHTLFLARLGDQLRFSEINGSGNPIMCYALDEPSFGTSFGSAHYQFFVGLKSLINEAMFGNKEIVIRCASGTKLTGMSPDMPVDDDTGDVTVRRFPLTVFRPIPGSSFSGRIALTRWLCASGSRLYEPSSVMIDGVVFALIDNGRIVDFEGEQKEVDKVRGHYDFVAEKYDIDGDVIHSWHAGFHPHNGYFGLATDNLSRWSGSAFGNPRYLHLHTCGAYAPGEICMSVFDPTVTVDGADMWRDGRLVFAETRAVKKLLSRYPGMQEIFDHPVMDYGLGEA